MEQKLQTPSTSFAEKVSLTQADKVGNDVPEKNGPGIGLDVTELFAHFTANIIKEDALFVR